MLPLYFRFWHFGEWVDVVVDDRLPVEARTNRLLFCSNPREPNEMFGPLLEKAYAKLNRCYEFIDGGSLLNALIDLSGGVGHRVRLRELLSDDDDDNETAAAAATTTAADEAANEVVLPDREEYLWELLVSSLEMKSLTGAVVKRLSGKNRQLLEDNQLILGIHTSLNYILITNALNF